MSDPQFRTIVGYLMSIDMTLSVLMVCVIVHTINSFIFRKL